MATRHTEDRHRGRAASLLPWIAAALLFQSDTAASETIHVPADVPTLQQAIDLAGPGDVIELAPGVYPAPVGNAATQGFRISNKQADFTIRAGPGGAVVLDGQNSRAVLRLQNTDLSLSGHIQIEGLTIRDGRSDVLGLTAGVTLQRAHATFRDCIFDSNQTIDPDTGGGGVQVSVGSVATFERSAWIANSSPFFAGGLSVEEHSSATVRDSLFQGNRVNHPGHQPTSIGGGIHIGNSTLLVERTRFEGNEAGYAGGGLYAIGLWDDSQGGSFVTVRDSTFVSNRARPDPGSPLSLPSEGGGVHAEDLAEVRIFDSRFLENEAHDGGGLNAYRADIEVRGSVFRGNRATGGAANGAKSLGGQISVISNDVSDASTQSGAVNRRPVRLIVEDSLLEGRFGATTFAGDVGGCLFAAGDTNRLFGNSVPAAGDPLANSAEIELRRVVLNDCDVQQHGVPGSGVGGAIAAHLVDLTLEDSLVLGSNAIGIPAPDNSSGGGFALLSHSRAAVSRTVFAGNTAGAFGGAIFAQGAHLEIEDSALVSNELSPGVREACWPESRGAALFTAPFVDGPGHPATGLVSGSLFSDNVGLPIFEDDRTDGPINEMRYDANEIYAPTHAGAVFTSVIPNQVPPFSVCILAAEMTGLTVQRLNGTSSPKVDIPNLDVPSSIAFASLVPSPPALVSSAVPDDPQGPALPLVAFAWSGGAATLNGAPLASRAGTVAVPPGSYMLEVDGGAAQAEIIVVPEPGSRWTGALLGAILLGAATPSARRARRCGNAR